MDKYEIKKNTDPLLLQAKALRDAYQFPEALAILHKLVAKYPENLTIAYLLAATYFESNNGDKALSCCDEILKVDPVHKETLELKGIILKKEAKYEDAEKYLLKALSIDPSLNETRKHLIALYFFYLNNLDKAAEHCEYMLTYRDADRDKMPRKKKAKVLDWILLIESLYYDILVCLKRYEDAARLIKNQISFGLSITDDKTIYYTDELKIYSLYYMAGDTESCKLQSVFLKEVYKITDERIRELELDCKINGIQVIKEEPPIMYSN